MAQITSGVRAILSHPLVYSSFQALMGARRFRESFVACYVHPTAGMKLLDVGCGPADILAHLPGVEYWGYDISEAYIEKARRTYGARAQFHCQQLREADLAMLPKFDVVLAIGLLHHLDDPVALEVLRLGHAALRPGGRMLTVDPCLDPSQNTVSRLLVTHDRGQNVRTLAGYEELTKGIFRERQVTLRHQAWIPYTHCIMQCTRSF